jgi:inner membrane protein
MSASSRRRWLTRLTPLELLLAAIVFVAADIGDQLTGGDTFLTSGPLDETAHLLTTLIVLWAIGGVVWERLLIPALIASVVIDLDHIPKELGYDFFTQGTPRPYTHSLLTIAIVLVAAWCWRRRRTVLLGIALGLALHLWRDTAEPASGVSLLWPVSDHSFSTSQASYLVLMAVAFAVGMRRSLRLEHDARERTRAGAEPARLNG